MKFAKLSKTSHLMKTLKSFGLSEDNFLASGCTATVFKVGNTIIKVCRKDIRYFSHYKGNAQSFKNHINRLGHIFLPVNQILYEDRDFFIYTQNLCQPLDKEHVTIPQTIQFLQIFKAMIQEKCMISGLSPHNLCFYQGRILIFDYHGLHKLKDLRSGRIARNLVKYMTLSLCPDKYSNNKNKMSHYSKKTIDKLTKMPPCFINLLKAMLKEKKSANIVGHIDACIQQLM